MYLKHLHMEETLLLFLNMCIYVNVNVNAKKKKNALEGSMQKW